MRKYCYILISAVLLLSLAYLVGRRSGITTAEQRYAADNITSDTVTVLRIDTIRIDKPVPVITTVTNTIRVQVRDTIRIHDTLYVQLQAQTKLYSDSTYRAQVSGFNPSLDWIEVYPRTVTETVNNHFREATKKARFGIGIQAGYGATKDGLSPYIGMGVSYNFLNF